MRGLYTAERWYDAAPKHLLFEPLVEGKRVLEIDCGAGHGSRLLARSAREVIGLCATEDELRAARAEAPHPRAFQPMTPGDLPFVDGTFDVVLALRGPDAFGGLDILAAEAHRLLKPSGFFCVASPNPGKRSLPDALQKTPPPKRSVGFYELQRRLKSRFGQVKMLAQSPFFGFAFVDYSPEDLDAFSLDTSLLAEGSEDPTSFLALCGKLRLPSVNFSLVQLPLEELVRLAVARAETPAAPALPAADPAEISRLKAQRQALLRAKSEWEEKAQDAIRQLRRLKARGAGAAPDPGAEAERAALQEQLQEAQRRIQGAQTELDGFKEREQKQLAERLRLERSLIEFMGRANEQSKELKEKEERVGELLTKVVRITNMERELKKQITEGRFTEKNLQTSLERREEELRDAERRLEKSIEEQRAQNEALRQRVDSLEAQNEALTRELTALRAQEVQLREEAARDAVSSQAEALEQTRARLTQETDEARAQLAEARAQLADQEYLLAEAVSRRIDAEWRAEEHSQEAALAQAVPGGAPASELEGRLESARRLVQEATARAQRAEDEAQRAREDASSLQARVKALEEERDGAAKGRAELEAALEEAERRGAAARERALAAAKDASSARARAAKLEEELSAALAAQQAPPPPAPDRESIVRAQQAEQRLSEERKAHASEREAATRERAMLAARVVQLETALTKAKEAQATPSAPAPVASKPEERPRFQVEVPRVSLALLRPAATSERAAAGLRRVTQRQAALLRRASQENAALQKRLAGEAAAPVAVPAVVAPTPAPAPAKPNAELAAVKASLEVSRLARAEAEKRLKESERRAKEAEEALAAARAELETLRAARA